MALNQYVKLADNSYVRISSIERAYVTPSYSTDGKWFVYADLPSGESITISPEFNTQTAAQTWLDNAVANSS